MVSKNVDYTDKYLAAIMYNLSFGSFCFVVIGWTLNFLFDMCAVVNIMLICFSESEFCLNLLLWHPYISSCINEVVFSVHKQLYNKKDWIESNLFRSRSLYLSYT